MFSEQPPQIPFKAPSAIASWLVIGLTIGLCIGLSYLANDGRGWAIGLSVGVIALLVQISWPLRKEGWFWATVAVLAAVHFWASVHFSWYWVSDRGGLKLLGSMFAVDYLAMVGLIYGVYRIGYGKPAHSTEPNVDDLPRYDARDLDL